MIKNGCPALNDENLLVINAVKPLNEGPVPENSLRVVVSEDEVDMSVKPSGFKTPIPLLNITEAEIPEMVNMVIRLNDRVPVSHQGIVHRFNRFKRPAAVFKDVGVEKMS